uniref:Uncharacterized protein n=1 Tax=Myoviridae sp. ctTrm2 TaxID=2825114 RepID=A0A8S5UK52_9CAUD|nr:MAG TPA: hypothetical protein [Myoviridae sp. ctTrm2]
MITLLVLIHNKLCNFRQVRFRDRIRKRYVRKPSNICI